jgi:hypothetical protein
VEPGPTDRARSSSTSGGAAVVVAAGGVGVQEDVGEPGDGVEELVAGVFEDVVGGGEVEGAVEGNVGVGGSSPESVRLLGVTLGDGCSTGVG